MMNSKIFRQLYPNAINWELWDELVEKTRREIAEAMKNRKPATPIYYIYNGEGELVRQFSTKRECAYFIGGSETTIRNYILKQWIYKGYLLTYKKLSKEEAIDLYNYNVAHGNVYLEGGNQKKMPIYAYNADGKLVGVFESKSKWSKVYKRTTSLLKDGDRVIMDRLVSTNKYSVETAKELYNKLAQIVKKKRN